MTNVLVPHSVTLRAAVRWISEERQRNPCVPLLKLIEEASRRFDLSPLDEQFLMSAYEAMPSDGAAA